MIEISNPQSISKEAAGILINALNSKNFDSFCYSAWNNYSSERQNLDVYDPVTNRLIFTGARIHASGGEGDGASLEIVFECKKINEDSSTEEFFFKIEGNYSSWADNSYERTITIVKPEPRTVIFYEPI